LLATLFESSYDLLKGLDLLQPDSYLRANDLIRVEPGEDETTDLLESRFQLSPSTVEAFLEEIGVRPPEKERHGQGYANQREYLVDLKLLHNLYRARARRLFNADRWWRQRTTVGDRAGKALSRRIERFERRIQTRLALSDEAENFPIQRLVRENGLTRSETIILLHLMFLELLEGNPYADTVFLIQLVSASEDEVLAHRRLFSSHATLRRRDLVDLEQMLEGRELTSECRLQNWVLDRVLGEDGADEPISADEKLNFHMYLKRLGSSNFLNDF